MLNPGTKNKLIILYMLDAVDFPLSSSQVSGHVLKKEYMDYFDMNKAFSELEEDDLVISSATHNSTQYKITKYGSQTLHYLDDKIPKYIKDEIAAYFAENEIELKNESYVYANYYKTGAGYATRCVVKEKGEPVFELMLNVPTKEIAISICDNWREKKNDVFEYLVDMLVK